MAKTNEFNKGWNFDNSYARLPEVLFSRTLPVPVRNPALVLLNTSLAVELGLDPEALTSEEGIRIFAGNILPPGAEPLAQAYAGHQFGHFTMLGDGRAILLGEQITPSGLRFDIQLKGSGQTPYSRRGDGRAALGPMLREYLISEAMHALGVPTTRSLAVVTSGEPVLRETALPGAILTRIAASHIRSGTFEYLAGLKDIDTLRTLVNYTLQRHYPDQTKHSNPAKALLDKVIDRQVYLVTRWMAVGFIHGVMNTDNMALSGETIDYGPCAFLDVYNPDTVFSSIDHQGRYAYGRQPAVLHWNLTRLAETLVPVLHDDQTVGIEIARELLGTIPARFHKGWLKIFRDKLGLTTEEEGDVALIRDLLDWMNRYNADFTNTFRGLSKGGPQADLYRQEGFQAWIERWHQRLGRQPESPEAIQVAMQAVNPAIIPRNHQVEAALEAAVQKEDLQPLFRLLKALSAPFEDREAYADLQQPAPENFGPYLTFCGT